jgi:hypothetical protein
MALGDFRPYSKTGFADEDIGKEQKAKSLFSLQDLLPLPLSQLFSFFASLVMTLSSHSDYDEFARSNDPLDCLCSKGIGIINIYVTTIGFGSSFYVSAIRKSCELSGSDDFVVKHTVTVRGSSSRSVLKVLRTRVTHSGDHISSFFLAS